MILILGTKGMLGGQLKKLYEDQAVGWDREDFDFTKILDYKQQIINYKPTAIINCVAYNDVDGAENNPEICFALNTTAVSDLAGLCNELNIPLVHFSTNYVFDGIKGEYAETDSPNPLSVYAQSKYQGELEIIKNSKKYYIIRTALLFGPKGVSDKSKKSFVEIMLELSSKRNSIKAIEDEINSLTYVVDLSALTRLLLEENKPFGIYHIVNSGQGSWFEYAVEIFKILKKNITVVPAASTEFPRKAKRPKKSVLINTKLPQLRPWQEALGEFLGS